MDAGLWYRTALFGVNCGVHGGVVATPSRCYKPGRQSSWRTANGEPRSCTVLCIIIS